MKKVSIYLDDRTADRLRERALRRHGTLRALSRDLGELVQDALIEEELEAALAEFGGVPRGFGFSDVKPVKPKPGPSTTEMIREEREHRHEGLPRHQRRR